MGVLISCSGSLEKVGGGGGGGLGRVYFTSQWDDLQWFMHFRNCITLMCSLLLLEFQDASQIDENRIEQLFSSCVANPKHPASMFIWGVSRLWLRGGGGGGGGGVHWWMELSNNYHRRGEGHNSEDCVPCI